MLVDVVEPGWFDRQTSNEAGENITTNRVKPETKNAEQVNTVGICDKSKMIREFILLVMGIFLQAEMKGMDKNKRFP